MKIHHHRVETDPPVVPEKTRTWTAGHDLDIREDPPLPPPKKREGERIPHDLEDK